MAKATVRSAIAHLYFETIHPFEDGNGRMGRVIAEKALSQTIGRQLKAIIKMMEAKPKGFEGGMTANKYISITKASKATRDLQILAELGVLVIHGGGRSTNYMLNMET